MNEHIPTMPNDMEYLTPEIGEVIPMLEQTCMELTRQALIREITEMTKELVLGDPELADILKEGSKTLEECCRYSLEQAAKVVGKNINSMLHAEMMALPKMKIHGRDASVAGAAISRDEMLKWIKAYYYDPKVKPADKSTKSTSGAKKSAGGTAPKKSKSGAKTDAKTQDGKATTTDNKADGDTKPADTAAGAATSAPNVAKGGQMSLFGESKAAA